jgi:ketosteroid isomerase-like protein
MHKTGLSIEDYTTIIKKWLESWSKADLKQIASFYSDNFVYRDAAIPQGIFNKEEFIKYFQAVFKMWPRQKWISTNIMPHAIEGAFSVEYDFEFANDKTSIKGFGIDRVEFKGDKIILNHVYLNADKWTKWVTDELKGI